MKKKKKGNQALLGRYNLSWEREKVKTSILNPKPYHKFQRRLLVSSTFMDQQLKSLISYIVLTLLMFFSLHCISREMGQRIKLFLDKI